MAQNSYDVGLIDSKSRALPFIRWGLDDLSSSQLNKRVFLTNISGVLLTLICLPWIFIFGFLGQPTLAIVIGMATIGYGLIPVINLFKFNLIARLWIIFLLVSTIMYFSLYMEAAFICLTFTPIIPVILFVESEKKYLIISEIILFCTAPLVFYKMQFSDIIIDYHKFPVVWFFLVLSCMVIVFIVTYVFSLSNYRKELMYLNEAESVKALNRALSHDTNNQLTIISGSVTLLDRHLVNETENTKKYIYRIKRSSDNIKDIINHIREIDQLKSGKKVLTLTPVSVEDIFEECRYTFLEKLKQKELSLNFMGENNLCIYADKISLMNSVINNLVSNSIKFSPHKSSIDFCVKSLKNNQVEIRIRDYGIGIPEDILANIFDFYRQTTRKGTDGEVGTGFGMPLVRTFVEYNKATMRIESIEKTPGYESHGTTAVLVFKCAQCGADSGSKNK